MININDIMICPKCKKVSDTEVLLALAIKQKDHLYKVLFSLVCEHCNHERIVHNDTMNHIPDNIPFAEDYKYFEKNC
jgi:uncharacterized protein YbaR (Trm112 family)